MNELFSDFERELIDSARMVLSDGLRRLRDRPGLFPTNLTKTRADRAEIISARDTLAAYLVATYGPLRHEVAAACLIDAQGRLIGVEEFPQGRADRCELSARILAGMVIRTGATAVILAHNHPSGDGTPSRADILVTKDLSAWLKAMETTLVDHLVVTVDDATSIMGGL